MALSEAAIGLDASYPAQPPQVAAIRRATSAAAKRAGAGVATLIRLELAVSEAATNVVLHAYRAPSAGGLIHVLAYVVRGTFDVTIRDNGCGMAPRSDSPGMGMGLSLMASEADRFEVRTVDGGGTEVRMRFLLGSAQPRPRVPSDRADCGERAMA
jgi:serine/threonine-protein kinase RsbW